jgi:hypothetical protein
MVVAGADMPEGTEPIFINPVDQAGGMVVVQTVIIQPLWRDAAMLVKEIMAADALKLLLTLPAAAAGLARLEQMLVQTLEVMVARAKHLQLLALA